MDSRSTRLPFCLSSSRPSYSSSSSRLYSTDSSLSSDRFCRTTSSYKTDSEPQSSRLRDYGGSDSRSSSWRLPSSLTTSTRAYDRPWADSSLTSRNKVSEPEGRFSTRSSLLSTKIDDGDSKRAKLTSAYSTRGLYSPTASTSFMGSSLSSSSSSSTRVSSDKENDSYDWRSSRLLSRQSSSSSSSSSPSSSKLFSRRETETKTEPSYSGLGERRTRTTGLTPSLYQTDRMTSTYAQGARPKETAYASTTFTSRESRHVPSSYCHRSSVERDLSSRSTSRFSGVQSSLKPTPRPEPAKPTSDFATTSSQRWYGSSRSENSLPPRPAPETPEIEGRSSTRRLLSRLFSRRSSQDSSGSSSVRSVEEDSPSTESADSDEIPPNVDPLLSESVTRRQHRVMYNPLCESNNPRSGLASRSEPTANSSVNANPAEGSGPSWLSSSIRSRCPPLLARLRRYAREENTGSAANPDYSYSRPSYLRKREEQDDEDEDEDEDDEEEEEEDEEKEGAVGVSGFEADLSNGAEEEEALPDLEEVSHVTRRRLGLLGEEGPEDQKEKPISPRDQEKLRKIKERLLMEDSDEEEGDLCRICQMGEESVSNPLIQPCRCTGSLQYVHQDCIKRWLRSKITSGTNLEGITTCELCKEKLRLNLDNFDIQELYRSHVQSEYDDFVSSGLYLVVLLHFCEQRFSDVLGAVDAAGLFNLVRVLHEHMDSLENGEGERRDTRPTIEFSDLDDDLEEY
ncbi:E3 ubiquitin-protein ligase MARCHF7 [Eucyclogobius newberryi]|uniref:E3 ubiquitin-protein ligase MARCHF7 n=1 Tax=Eucyclogobius newberryi TaxID=166745 RepID=UPI003B5C1F3A